MNLAPPGTAAGVSMLGGVPGSCCCAVALVWGSHSASTAGFAGVAEQVQQTGWLPDQYFL